MIVTRHFSSSKCDTKKCFAKCLRETALRLLIRPYVHPASNCDNLDIPDVENSCGEKSAHREPKTIIQLSSTFIGKRIIRYFRAHFYRSLRKTAYNILNKKIKNKIKHKCHKVRKKPHRLLFYFMIIYIL